MAKSRVYYGVLLKDVETLGVSSEPQYFDSEQGRFRDTLTYTIKCYSVEVKNSNGVSQDVVSSLNDLRTTEDYSVVTLENEWKFPNLKLLDFSIEEGNFTDYGLATLVFEKYEPRAVNQMAGSLYNCLEYKLGKVELQSYFENFTESFDFSEGKDSTSYTYNLDIALREQAGDLRIGDDSPQNDPAGPNPWFNLWGNLQVNLARQFAKQIFECPDRPPIPVIPASLTGIYQSGFKKTYTENIDLIGNTCSFSEIFNTTNIEGTPSSYGFTVTQQSARHQGNIVTVTENGSIVGLGTNFDANSRYGDAQAALDLELTAATGRLDDFFEQVRRGGDYDLNSGCEGGVRLFSQEITRNTFEGKIDYSVTANNDPKFSGHCEGGFVQVQDVFTSEQANYSGLARTVTIEGWGAKVSGENNTTTVVYPRFDKAYEIMIGNSKKPPLSVYNYYKTGNVRGYAPSPTSENWAYDKNNGQIALSFEHSSNPVYQFNSPESGIKKFQITYDQTNTLPKANIFQGLNLGVGANMPDQIIQQSTYSIPQGLQASSRLVRVRDSDFATVGSNPILNELLAFTTGQLFKSEVLGPKDDPGRYIIQGVNYTYSPINNITLDLSIDFASTSGTEVSLT